MIAARRARWGAGVDREPIAGHEGLAWSPRPLSVSELIDGMAAWDDGEFIVFRDRRISFAQQLLATDRAAAHLWAAGVRPGDRLLLLAFNSPEWATTLLGAWRVGAVPVLGNRWWAGGERGDAVSLIEPAAIVTDLGRNDSEGLGERPVLWIDQLEDETSATVPWSAAPDSEDDPALIIFTSGTSGAPKGVVLSHRAVIANQHNLLYRSGRLTAADAWARRSNIALVTLPLFHVGGVSNLISAMVMGTKLVFMHGRFDAGEVLRLIEAERVTNWGGVPTMARRVVEHPDFERRDLTSLRSFPLGGAPVTAEMLDLLRRKLPHIRRGLGNTWGLTESGGFLTLAAGEELVDRVGTVGKPYPVVEVRVDEPDPLGVGELLVRSPTVMLGYVGVADDQTVDGEGWLRTGDLGRVDDDGYVYVTGRAKDVVIRGGENIACSHVEGVIASHPGVREVAVVGVPHYDLGEELVAVVVPEPHAALAPSELLQWCRERLASFEVPARFETSADQLPTLASGKLDKATIRSRVLQHRGRSSTPRS